MSCDIAIHIKDISKCFQIYERPYDRLKQSIYPRLQRLGGLSPKKYYKDFWALKNISLLIKRGETVGIIGRNGSGKSTLLQIICGTLSPTFGSITTQGRIAALLELGAGFNNEFTGRENILLNAAILGFSHSEIINKIDHIVDFSELGEFVDQPVKTYSSGMLVRLAFSVAIHIDPTILIVDEALAVGDARFQAKCMKRIKDIKLQGTSILFVSHDISSVRTLCDRAIWLDSGAVLDQGDVFPVTGRYMEHIFKDDPLDPNTFNCNLLDPSKQNPEHLLSHQIGKCENNLEGQILDDQMTPGISTNGLNARPVTHWGSSKGIILNATIKDLNTNKNDILLLDSPCEVLIEVNIPNDISREHLSIAFSIKDMKGTDLLVSATYDSRNNSLPNTQHFEISFKFKNLLVTGMYLLVAAVENRQYRDIHYYEYIEGAQYFSSISNTRVFGIYHPIIEQTIRIKND